jgi:ferredoxin
MKLHIVDSAGAVTIAKVDALWCQRVEVSHRQECGGMTELQSMLVEAIKDYVHNSPLNRLTGIDDSPIWEEPLVGFADGDDPLFDDFKTVVGEAHLTPREALAAHLQDSVGSEPPAMPRVGVVSWVLPAARETKLGNREMTVGPSRRWNHTRFQGEAFNDSLRRYVVSWLEARGCAATAPVLTGHFVTGRSCNGLTSTWSERHVAYAAGHGTFGLSDGLITVRGIAHHCGSVVAGAGWLPSPRRYSHHLEYCPYPVDGSCGVCIKRCPAGAIGPGGHDKDKCREYLFVTLAEWVKQPGYVGSYGACGLCQTQVPCESRVPCGG